jgi:copper chaperone
MRKLAIEISGMSCGHCVAAVRGALEAVPGVQVGEVRVGGATVSYDPAAANADAILDAVREEGYEPRAATV